MAEEADMAAEEASPRRLPWRTAAKWIGIALATLLLLIALAIVGINTDPGRRYVVRQINNIEMASGLDIDIGRIEGSLYGKLTIHDLTLKDPGGTFFMAPVAEVDWRPFAYLRNHIDIESLVVPRAHLMRLPELRPGDPDAPLLPDIDIDVGRLEVGRLLVDPAVTGQRHLVTLSGGAKIADGRAQIAASGHAIAAPGTAGGDRLVLRLDAVPEQNRFDVEARLQAPANGLVAGIAGFDRPLTAAISGRGSWENWSGRAQARLGGEALANLAIIGRDGTFQVDGPLRPGLFLAEGPFQRLVSPLVQVNLVTTLSERRADTRLRLRSSALAVAAEGLVDLGENQFEGLRVAARLLRPGAIAPNLNGRDVQLALVLNGPFATPVVAYDLRAAALGFDETVVQGLRARGRARVDADRITIPVSAMVQRITGLNEAVGGLLTNVRLDGMLNIAGSRILSDDLRIRSDRINATAIIVADLAKGEYRAGLQGRVNNYLIEGIGLLDIDSDLDVVSRGEGFGITGRVAIRTRRIDNASARDFLGGQAIVTAAIDMDEEGTVRISGIRLSSPNLRITSGRGVYRPSGAIDFSLTGVSTAYGPLAVEISGTVDQPNIRLRARSPGFGIGLANVEADVRSTPQGYRITARGDSDYGPFTAEITILSRAGPLTIEVHRLTIAGITLTGRVVQTSAGPFAGTLALSGSGLDGTVRLAATGQYQRADISARANGAQIPGETPILVQRGIIEATAILYPNAPSIVGDVQLAGVRRGEMAIEAARARINYRGGRGQAQLVANGSTGVPWRVGANVALAPDHIRAAAQGTINRVDFRFAQPADVRKIGNDWVLAPTTVVFPQGGIRLAGRFGDGLVIQSRMNDLDLSLVNAFVPNLGLGGRVTGSLDFSQPSGASFPRADARLRIDDFTRTGVATLSEAVDIAFAGQLRPEGGSAGAVFRRNGAIIGRAQARLQPLAPGAGSWTTRLLASPLSGGVRYNGPADVLWSLTGIADQQLSGPIGIAADFSGRVQDPQFNGVVHANNLILVDETYGTRITNVALHGRFTGSRFEISELSGRAGSGTVTGRGSVDLSSAAGFPIDVRLAFNRAQLARSDAIGATVTGEVAITNGPGQPALISGDLQLPEVRYQIIRQGAAQIAELEGVHKRGEPLPRPDEVNQRPTVPSIWNLDLRVRANNEVFVSGMGLESEWSTDLRIGGTSSHPIVTGTAEVIRGTYSFAGTRFELTNGDITFTGSDPIDPRVAITATGDVEDITVTINVSGRSSDPQIAFSSSPALPQDEIMARLLFGGSVTELSALEAVQLAASLNSLRGGGGGLNPLGQLRSATGLSRLRILGADEATGRGTALSAGFYLGDDIYLEVITDARGFTATQLEIALSKSLSLLSQAGSFAGTSASIRYRKEY